MSYPGSVVREEIHIHTRHFIIIALSYFLESIYVVPELFKSGSHPVLVSTMIHPSWLSNARIMQNVSSEDYSQSADVRRASCRLLMGTA
jgi:hypothetical protein